MNNIIFIIIIFIIFIIFKKTPVIENLTNTNNKYKYVCLYAYYEKNEKYKNNLNFFLKNGILDEILYYIIINGNKCTISIPNKKNIIVIYRNNIGYDFGAWSECIEKYIKDTYEYYIFINTSVIGPIIDKNKNWLHEFLKLFNTKDVKLVGTSINMLNNNTILKYYYSNFKNSNVILSHVQSMFFILDYEGFKHLVNHNLFNYKKIASYSFYEVILNCEVKMSQIILNNNWNINCILSKYKNLDYRITNTNINPSGQDPYHKNSYFGKTIQPEEVIFFKTNRF